MFSKLVGSKSQKFVSLVALLSCTVANAETTAFDPFKYSTLGVWASTPLSLSARVGLAVPLNNESALTVGNEFGLYGNKQFVGYRVILRGHGVAWGGVELAHWKTRSHAWLADSNTDYYGVEAHLLVFRAGLMFPQGEGHHPTLTAGAGFGF